MLKLEIEELTHLQQFLVDDFSFSELKDIAFDMGLDCENFPLDSKVEFSRAMLNCVLMYHNLSCLLVYMEKRRQNQEIAQLLNRLPPCQPRKKVELVLRDLNLRGLDRAQLKASLARLLNLRVEEVGMLGIAPVGLLCLVGLPKDAAAKLSEFKPLSLSLEGYPVESISYYDSLSPVRKAQWYKTVRGAWDVPAPPQLSQTAQRVSEPPPPELERTAQSLRNEQTGAAPKFWLAKPLTLLLGFITIVVVTGIIVVLIINLFESHEQPTPTPTSVPQTAATTTTPATTTTTATTTTPATSPVSPPVTSLPQPELKIKLPTGLIFGTAPFVVEVNSNSDAAAQFNASGSCNISPQGEVTITGAGSCTITVRQEETAKFMAAEVSQTLTIGKARATLSLKNLSQQYDGKPKEASYTITPALADAKVVITYNSKPDKPVNAGSYTVEARLEHPNYSGNASSTLVITPGNASITFEGLGPFIYDGNPKVVTATATPSGTNQTTPTADLKVVVTYNGSPTPPTQAGSYNVVGTLQNPNYTGSASATLVIKPQPVEIRLFGLGSFTYDGTPKLVTVTVLSIETEISGVSRTPTPLNLPVKLTYNNSNTPPTEPGEYTVTATMQAPNYTGTASGTLTITKIKVQLSFADNFASLDNFRRTYNGTQQPVAVYSRPAVSRESISVTYNGATTLPVNAGTYRVVATVNAAHYEGSAATNLIIDQAPTSVTLQKNQYGNLAFPINYTTVPPELKSKVRLEYYELVGNNYELLPGPPAPGNEGTFKVRAVLEESQNYQGSSDEVVYYQVA
jgi:hypothetical protein